MQEHTSLEENELNFNGIKEDRSQIGMMSTKNCPGFMAAIEASSPRSAATIMGSALSLTSTPYAL